MSNILKEIIDHFNNNHLDKALNLCEANNEKKIEVLQSKYWTFQCKYE